MVTPGRDPDLPEAVAASRVRRMHDRCAARNPRLRLLSKTAQSAATQSNIVAAIIVPSVAAIGD
jgi:hypothetical protein